MSEEPVQWVTLFVSLLGIAIWLHVMRTDWRVRGWGLLPIGVFVLTVVFYVAVLIFRLRDQNIDLTLMLAASLRLYTIITLAMGGVIMIDAHKGQR
jgi:hypothetical protein